MKNSMSNQGKVKRDIAYDGSDGSEIVAPVYQTAPLDYSELHDAMDQLYDNYYDIQNEKRFLGKFFF